MSTPRTVVAAAVLVLAGLVAPTSVARAADEPAPPTPPPAGAPITQADHVTVAVDSGAEIDVLANDSDPDSTTNHDLTICRVEPSADDPVSIYASEGYGVSGADVVRRPVLGVFAPGAELGTYTLTYHVCDYDYLSAATVTVTVVASQEPYAEVLTGRPGYVRFHNPDQRRVVIQHGSTDGRTVDGRFALAAGASKTVRIERHTIHWTATIRTRDGLSTSGHILRGIEQPAGRSRTTSAPAADRTPADRTAWRVGTHQLELRSRTTSSPYVSPGLAGRDESTDAPVTSPDATTVPQGWFSFAHVLGNDTDPDGATDDLAICRASAPAGSHLSVTPLAGDGGFFIYTGSRRAPRSLADEVDPVPYSLLVQARERAPRGTYEVTYYACDHQYLTPATVTVTVTRSQTITARKVTSRPGVVRFTNPGPHGARVQVRELADPQQPGARSPLIARFRLPAHSSRTIRPDVRQIFWSARSRRGPGGVGTVLGIGRPPRG